MNFIDKKNYLIFNLTIPKFSPSLKSNILIKEKESHEKHAPSFRFKNS